MKDGLHLVITPKTFDVLQLLVERYGQVVSKDELLGTVWNGKFIEEGNLPVHISKLRRSLCDESDYFIETVNGTGYRFTAQVWIVTETEWRSQLSANNFAKEEALPVLLANECYDRLTALDEAAKIISDTADTLRRILPRNHRSLDS